jgi:hypothetical protein
LEYPGIDEIIILKLSLKTKPVGRREKNLSVSG